MPGGRKTHNFPYGKPLSVVVTEIAFTAAGIVWMFVGLSRGWRVEVTFVAVFVSILLLHSKLIGNYERTGRAVPIRRQRVVVRFHAGLPAPMLAARMSFFVAVAIMLFFGLTPIAEATAMIGM